VTLGRSRSHLVLSLPLVFHFFVDAHRGSGERKRKKRGGRKEVKNSVWQSLGLRRFLTGFCSINGWTV